MENSRRIVNNNEVISVAKEDKILISHHTYKAEEFLHKLGDQIDHHKMERWCIKGVPCEVLTPNQGWKKGKIKIGLEFCPDEVESPLEDIRKEMDI